MAKRDPWDDKNLAPAPKDLLNPTKQKDWKNKSCDGCGRCGGCPGTSCTCK